MLKQPKIINLAIVSLMSVMLVACNSSDDAATDQSPVVRGLKTVVVQDQEQSTIRKYPSVLQPASISKLSFEVAGNVMKIDLDVGQVVKKGQFLAEIDSTSLKLQIESAEAEVRKATSAAETASADYERKATLLKKGIVANITVDQSKNEAKIARESLIQSTKQLASAQENLTKAKLVAPFDGVINTVDVTSFTTVSSGVTIATMYSTEEFEASFSVNYDIASLLSVGKMATVRMANNPSVKIDALVTELGARAGAASSFPVVVKLEKISSSLKSGMALEVSMEFEIENGKGYVLPLTVLALGGKIEKSGKGYEPNHVVVFVFDEATSTVKPRRVKMVGIRGNSLIIAEGLKLGDRVASAGVPFLRDGMVVKLLPDAVGE